MNNLLGQAPPAVSAQAIARLLKGWVRTWAELFSECGFFVVRLFADSVRISGEFIVQSAWIVGPIS